MCLGSLIMISIIKKLILRALKVQDRDGYIDLWGALLLAFDVLQETKV